MKVTKRNGTLVFYDDEKIVRSILRANEGTKEALTNSGASYLAGVVFGRLAGSNEIITTQDIREGVYSALREKGLYVTARKYMDYEKQGK